MTINKYLYVYVIQGYYGSYWEDLLQSESWREAKDELKAYREAEGDMYSHRMINRRELNPKAKANVNTPPIEKITMHYIKHACALPHWFAPDTMRFFNTRLPKHGYKGNSGSIFFVSSECSGIGDAERMYTVRHLTEAGKIKTIGEFNVLTRSEANRLAKEYATNGTPVTA